MWAERLNPWLLKAIMNLGRGSGCQNLKFWEGMKIFQISLLLQDYVVRIFLGIAQNTNEINKYVIV